MPLPENGGKGWIVAGNGMGCESSSLDEKNVPLSGSGCTML